MLNIDLQQMLQEYPDDMEVCISVNGISNIITKVSQLHNVSTTIKYVENKHITYNREDMIVLKGINK